MSTSKLGDYLRSRRAQVTPSDVGLPEDGRRRVPGLRREEVAMLARISVDYYLRLEQGRERRPSPQVLDALSDALLLDDDGRLHLYRIAGLTPLPRYEGSIEQADAQLLALAELWDRTPALLLGRAYDVLAANTLGRAVFPHLQPGANVLLTMFLDPSVRAFHADWERAAANAVAGFRFLEGARPNDPRIQEVLQTVSERSHEFAGLWRRRDARGKSDAAKVLLHPDVGELTLRMQAFDVRSAPGQQLIVYHAQEGTGTADALRLLGSLAVTTRPGHQDDSPKRAT
ncbi:helix-turn-helix transcriptional regulator [Streptomyces chitinivorans]|uniref:Helix-turn-helix transcriptional regulator n=1 Tax=Streptomyces chitinivorans TaxID=1257027 RepID=A0ABW7I0Q9_9ACTN|nr:helix-turn-helix transcriptional regulator [Streptomyces chitinivorans]MDH2412194.1 helix-turn-helix transcriptional regulator [Streptomyces chitinivorans]